MLAVIRLLHSALVPGVGAGGQLALDVQDRVTSMLHVPGVTMFGQPVTVDASSVVQDRVTSMLHVPGLVGQPLSAVQALVVSRLQNRLTLAHWLATVQLVPVLMLQLPATTGHCVLLKHAVPV